MLSKFKFTLAFCALAIALVSSQNGYPRFAPENPLGYPSDDVFNGYSYGRSGQGESVGSVPGVAGRDYPVYSESPETAFRCEDQEFPGYYADPEAQCQAFHICQADNRKDSFLCPNGTLFNQEFLVCDWWNHVDCDRAQEFYGINADIFRAMQEATRRLQELAAQRAREQYEREQYERQRQAGYNYNRPGYEGRSNGNNGYNYAANNNGNNNGYSNGYSNGYNNGYSNGNNNGYTNGNSNGYETRAQSRQYLPPN